MNSTAKAENRNVQGKTAQVFQFKQQQDVRAVMIDGEPWFAATDVCQALTIANTARALSRLDDDEKGIHSMNTPGGAQELGVVNESGLYSLILTSRKPEAKAFKKWVTSEVLPSIRKTGAYIHAPALRPALSKDHAAALNRELAWLCNNWATGDEGKGWIFNHLRVVFQVARVDDIPDDQFDLVVQILRTKRDATMEFCGFLLELREWFVKEVFGAGTPWTPAIKSKLTRQLKRQVILPPKVDWLALAQQVDQKAEGSKAA